MKTLPVTPVDALAQTPRAAATDPAARRNPGIVPPWLQHPDRNPGIVPPWLGDVVQPTVPVGDDEPRILSAFQSTVYDPTPVEFDPDTPRIWQR